MCIFKAFCYFLSSFSKLFSSFSFSDSSLNSSTPLLSCPTPFCLLFFSHPLLLSYCPRLLFSCISPSWLLSFLPHPHLLLRVAYQSLQCHDYKDSERNSCPCLSASHWDQVTKRGCESVVLVWH